MMSDADIVNATTTLAVLLRQTALSIAEAQAALDAHAEARHVARDADTFVPQIAFGFSEVEIDLSLGMSVVRHADTALLQITPTGPLGQGFFQAASFNSRLRARIAPFLIQPAAPTTEA